MVTIDLETGEIIEGSFTHGEENRPEFQEERIDHILDDERTFPRSETPDTLYELVPQIDELSRIKITVEDSLEKIWLNEVDEGKLTMAVFIPLSAKRPGRGLALMVTTIKKPWRKSLKI